MLKQGDVVRAKVTVTESGNPPGDETATFPQPQYIHAKPGELGDVVHTEPGFHPTVMFRRTKTATIVLPEEVEPVS